MRGGRRGREGGRGGKGGRGEWGKERERRLNERGWAECEGVSEGTKFIV